MEFDNREPPTFPEGNIVEVSILLSSVSEYTEARQWHPQLQVPLDGFEILRRGDVNVNCRIVFHIAHQPERFRVMQPLANLIALREGTRSDVMLAVWKLVKVARAQDKEDGTILRPVGGLEKVSTRTF